MNYNHVNFNYNKTNSNNNKYKFNKSTWTNTTSIVPISSRNAFKLVNSAPNYSVGSVAKTSTAMKSSGGVVVPTVPAVALLQSTSNKLDELLNRCRSIGTTGGAIVASTAKSLINRVQDASNTNTRPMPSNSSFKPPVYATRSSVSAKQFALTSYVSSFNPIIPLVSSSNVVSNPSVFSKVNYSKCHVNHSERYFCLFEAFKLTIHSFLFQSDHLK